MPSTNDFPDLRVKRGFRVELVAAAPDVTAPAAMAFDERGRLFVAEMRDYPDRRDRIPHLGRIRVFEDLQEDGTYRTNRVYADNLPWPSAVACYGGGVYVAATPDILYFKDTKGDGIADVRKVVFSGFGGSNAPTAGALLNNFNWGLDNRIHAGTAGIGGLISTSNSPASGSMELGANDFSFDPRSLDFKAEGGPARSGLTFDDWGRKFLCDLAHPLQQPMYEPRYAARNPFYAKPPMLADVANPATMVFRFTAVEMPRPRASRPGEKNRAAASVPLKTNVLSAAWLADARGCVVYRGNLFPSNYLENAFVTDADGHLIHRMTLFENGLQVVAGRATDEAGAEFLVSDDPAFRPVQAVNGPDGALYIADMQDGGEHGRILRVVPDKFKRPKPPRLDQVTPYELVAALAQPNGWVRDTAARLLFERRDPEAVRLLKGMLNNSRLAQARLQALHALDGLDALQEEDVLTALGDDSEAVRELAVLLTEKLAVNGMVSDALWDRLRALPADPSPRVRHQLALTLGEIHAPDRAMVLAGILRRDLLDPYIRNAVLSSSGVGGGELFTILAGDPPFRNSAPGQEFLRELATMLGVQGRLEEVRRCVVFLAAAPAAERPAAFGLLYSLGNGLHRTRSALAPMDLQGGLQVFYTDALAMVIDDGLPEPLRVETVRLLSISPYMLTDLLAVFNQLLTDRPFRALQSATLASLGRYDDARVMPALLANWPNLTPPLRTEAVSALLARASRIPAVMDAVASGRMPPGDLSWVQVNFLRTCRAPAVSQRAVDFFGPVPLEDPILLQQFRPALRLPAMREHGRAIFLGRCAECHRLAGQGRMFGPDLDGARVNGKETLLASILQPNAGVEAANAVCVLESNDGEIVIGLKTDENAATITLRQPGGASVVWPQSNVRSVQTTSWSLMPGGLERGLDAQDMADLLDYLMTVP